MCTHVYCGKVWFVFCSKNADIFVSFTIQNGANCTTIVKSRWQKHAQDKHCTIEPSMVAVGLFYSSYVRFMPILLITEYTQKKRHRSRTSIRAWRVATFRCSERELSTCGIGCMISAANGFGIYPKLAKFHVENWHAKCSSESYSSVCAAPRSNPGIKGKILV